MKNYFNGHNEVVYAMNGMENNVTLFLQRAGVHQGLQYQTKVVDKGMTLTEIRIQLLMLGAAYPLHKLYSACNYSQFR